MGHQQDMLECKSCEKKTLHTRTTPNTLLHIFLSIITAGFWLMKKTNLILIILAITINIFFISNSNAKNTKLVKSEHYSEGIKWRFLEYDLPSGKWEFFHKFDYTISTIRFHCIEFAQIENDKWKSFFDICEIGNGGKHAHLLSAFLIKELKNGKYDNCQLRPEYYYAKLFTKGTTMNCFKVAHRDVNKELNFADDPQAPSLNYIKKYLKKKGIKTPLTALCSISLFYSPSIKDKGIEIGHCINPELYGAPKILNASETKSEYHRDNIDNFPEQKKFFDNWLVKKAQEHKNLERKLKAKNHQLINLDELLITKENNNDEILENLKSLNDLYNSGVLTKEEFENAKDKILN